MTNETNLPGCGSTESAIHAFRLLDQGYCLLKQTAAAETIPRVVQELERDFAETPFCRGAFYGDRTKRFGRLLTRSPTVAGLVLDPIIMPLVEQILGPWCDALQLNVAQAIAIHSGALAQFPHRDQDMYWGEKGRIEYLVNVMWPLDPFTKDNGATMLWPDSHGSHALDGLAEGPPLIAAAEPGDAIVFLGSTLHGAGANRSHSPRRGIVIGYSLGWLKPYENPWLAYPPEIARAFPPALAALVGYRQHRPNLGNFEGQCPSILLKDAVPERLAAIDALRPHEAALLAHHAAGQLGKRGGSSPHGQAFS